MKHNNWKHVLSHVWVFVLRLWLTVLVYDNCHESQWLKAWLHIGVYYLWQTFIFNEHSHESQWGKLRRRGTPGQEGPGGYKMCLKWNIFKCGPQLCEFDQKCWNLANLTNFKITIWIFTDLFQNIKRSKLKFMSAPTINIFNSKKVTETTDQKKRSMRLLN